MPSNPESGNEKLCGLGYIDCVAGGFMFVGCVGNEQQPGFIMAISSSRCSRPEPGFDKEERCAKQNRSALILGKTLM